MPERKVIGLAGFKESGKDTAAEYLATTHDWVYFGMSDALAKAMWILDPIIPVDAPASSNHMRWREYVEWKGYTAAKKNPEVRRLLQTFGTEIVREMFGEDTWVNLAYKRAEGLLSYGNRVAITGIRFKNEVDMIRDLGGEVIFVDRPGLSSDGHASESFDPAWADVHVSNNTDLEGFYQRVEQLGGWR